MNHQILIFCAFVLAVAGLWIMWKSLHTSTKFPETEIGAPCIVDVYLWHSVVVLMSVKLATFSSLDLLHGFVAFYFGIYLHK